MHEHSIIETGGKQYMVTPGTTVTIGNLTDEVGATLTFPDLLGGKAIKATVVSHGRTPTIRVIKFRNKTRGLRRRGHRQAFTTIRIEAAQ